MNKRQSISIEMFQSSFDGTKNRFCPGKYCAYSDVNRSSCGACPRGSRVNVEKICQFCTEPLSLYNFMYLIFMCQLALSFHAYSIHRLQKKKPNELTLVKQTMLHFSSLLELIFALICTLLSFPPFGQLTVNVCPVKMLSDFYPIFHNPIINYQKKLRCSYEIVYPLQSAIVLLYTYATVLMLILRPIFSSIIDRKLLAASIYSALHFYPCLVILHALLGGLIYFSFPILTISSGILLNAIHFTLIANGEDQWISFLRKLCTKTKNWILYFIHLIILFCGLISLTQFEQNYHLIFLPTVLLPAILYILLYKFTATAPLRSNTNNNNSNNH